MARSAGIETKRLLEAARRGTGDVTGSKVPFSTQVIAVTGVPEQLRESYNALVQVTVITRLPFLIRRQLLQHVAETCGVRIDTGQQHGATRRTHRGTMKIGETNSCIGQPIEIGGRNLATKTAKIRKGHVVNDN